MFQACNAWAKAECARRVLAPSGKSKRLVLGKSLFLLGFPTMNPMDLVNIVYPTDILTPAEKEALSAYKHTKTASEYSLDFPLIERKFLLLAEAKLGTQHGPNQKRHYFGGGDRRGLSGIYIV